MKYEARVYVAGNGTSYMQIFEDGDHVADVVTGREDLAAAIVAALSETASEKPSCAGDGGSDDAGSDHDGPGRPVLPHRSGGGHWVGGPESESD